MTAPSKQDQRNESKEEKTRTVGLLASPDHCVRIANDIAEPLEERLERDLDSSLSWHVEVVTDPLSGSNASMAEVLSEIASSKDVRGWDYAISLTDVPIRRDDRIVIGETGKGLDVAVVSVPALGAIRVPSRVLSVVLELMDDLYRGTTSKGSPTRFLDEDEAHRDLSTEEQADGDLRYSAPRIRGHIRLLSGMVYANRPWQIFPSFKTAVATAFATGGYGLIFTTLWEIGNVYTYTRLVALMFAAMFFLSGWIIVSHGLWERPRESVSPYLRRLYNTTTVLTIGAGVVFSYAIVFLLLLSAAVVYIPIEMLESTIGRAVEPMNYVRVAWVASSVATIAGAIGAGLEDPDDVRNATFGWRQSNRWKQYQREREERGEDVS